MRAPRTIVALAAVAAATVAGGCGSSNTLPKDIPPVNASSLIENLNTVAAACQQGDAAGVRSAVSGYMQALSAVPDDIDPDVKKILTETGTRLQSLAQDATGCQTGASGTSGLSGFVPTDTTATTTTTAPTTTTTTETTTTQPEEPTPPADNGNGGADGGNQPPAPPEPTGSPGGNPGTGGTGGSTGGSGGSAGGSGGIGAG